jgi:hypothetical protein
VVADDRPEILADELSADVVGARFELDRGVHADPSRDPLG